jgi:NTE family protein
LSVWQRNQKLEHQVDQADQGSTTPTRFIRPAISAPTERSAPRQWQISLTAGLVIAIATMDLTMVGTAIPILSSGAADDALFQLSWAIVVTAIPVALLLLPALARANRIGHKKVAGAGMLMFTIGALISTVAPTMAILIFGRLLQGGIALGIAGTLAICASGHNVGRMLKRWTVAGAVGLVAGPLVAGALLQFESWRLLFLFEALLGALAYFFIRYFLVAGRADSPPPRRPLMGGVIFGFGLLLLTWGLSRLTDILDGTPESPPGELADTVAEVDGQLVVPGVIALAGALMVVLGVGRMWQARRARNARIVPPIWLLPPLAVGISLSASLLTNALYLVGIQQLDSWSTAIALLPLLVSLVVVMTIVRPFARPQSVRPLLILGGLIWVGSLGTLLVSVGSSDVTDITWILLLAAQGVGMGAILAVTGDPAGQMRTGDSTNETAVTQIVGVQATLQLGVAIGVIAISLLSLGSQLTDPGNLERGWLVGIFAGIAIIVLAIFVRHPDAWMPTAAPEAPVALEETPQFPRKEVRRRPTSALLDFLPQMKDMDPLAALSMFADLSSAQRERLAQEGEAVNILAGEHIYSAGERADALYIVRSGRVDLKLKGVCISSLGRGDVFGEAEVLAESPRSVSAVARRDSLLMRIQRSSIMEIDEASFYRVLAVGLSEQLDSLKSSADLTLKRSDSAYSIITVMAADATAPTAIVGQHLEPLLQSHRTVIAPGRVDRLGLERAESLGEIVLLVDDPSDQEWSHFCRRVADRTVVVTTDAAPSQEIPQGSHVVIVDAQPTAAQFTQWFEQVQPASRTLVRSNHLATDLGSLSDLLLHRSLGIAFGGGGARGIAHIGVMDVLTDAGIHVDRFAGTSMGAIVGCMFASGLGPDAVDVLAYDVLVRGNPMSDYTIPRKSLLRGRRVDAAMHNLFGDMRIESLPLPFACVSVDLVTRQEVVHRSGPIVDALLASSRLPGILPPYLHSLGGVHVDGALLNNLPVNVLNREDGPIIAIAVGGQESLTEEMALENITFADTIMRSLMMASDNANVEAHDLADLVIRPDTSSAGLTEFHRIDAMREAGQLAALAALPEIKNLLNRS